MSTASPSSPQKRRGLSRWFKVTVILVLVMANLAGLAALWAIQTGQNFLASAQSDKKVSAVLDTPPADGPLTFLLVGSDSRAGLDDLSDFGDFPGARSDVIMLVRVDDDSSDIQMLSIPRDLWVDIPGHKADRINASYALGGSTKLVETIRQNLNVEINHYVEVDFVGFMGLIDELGGITLTFANPARDTKSHLRVDAGTQIVDGKTALAYARSRSYQEQQNGRWVAVEANDIGRTKRQQQVMTAILKKLKTPSSLVDAGSISQSLAPFVTIDTGLAGSSASSLLWDFRGVITGGIEGATLPVTGLVIGGKQVVKAREPAAAAVLAAFRAGQSMEAGEQAGATGPAAP